MADISAKRLVFVLVASIFVGELLIMLFLSAYPITSPLLESLLDASLLSTFSFPIIYFFVFRPFTKYISILKQADKELRIAATAFESQEGMFVTDANQFFLRVNNAFASITGYETEDVVGKTPRILSSGRHDADFYSAMWKSITSTGSWRGEVWNRRKNGEEYAEWLTITSVKGGDGEILNYVGTLSDITEQKQTEAEVALLRERALEASKLKSAFISTMSHEMRTPMNGVMGMANLLLDTQLDDQQHDFALTVRDSADALLTIINDILDFSKIESGKLEIENIAFDLRSVVEGSINVLSPLAQEKHLKLTSFVDGAIPQTLVGDPGRLRQIVLNFLSNAVKFTATGGITLRVREKTVVGKLHHLHIEVEDTGIGVSNEVAAKLFRPFVQADGSVSRKYGGTGLGLSICKELAELMHGQIGIDPGKEQGSIFWIELMLEEGALPVLQQTNAREQRSIKIPVPDIDTALEAGTLILLVEDNLVNYKIASQYLRKLGYASHVVENGQLAVEAVKSVRYGLVLMDCQMPVMDGYEATRIIRLREHVTGHHIPIVAMTANAMSGDRKQCLEAGMDDYLTKPINFHVLKETLTQWLPLETSRDSN